MISQEKRHQIVKMHGRGFPRSEIARALGVSGKTVKLWLDRHAAGEGMATRAHSWPFAPQINTTEAGYAVAGLEGWFAPADVRAVTEIADVTALLKKMRGLGALERRGLVPHTEHRSLVTPRGWLEKRKVWWLHLLPEEESNNQGGVRHEIFRL